MRKTNKMLEIDILFKALQLLLSLVIIGLAYDVHRRSRFKISKVRFKIFALAFASFAILVLTEILIHASIGPYELVLFIDHLAGLIFFLLIGTFGILHFTEQKYMGGIRRGSYYLVFAAVLSYTTYTVISWYIWGKIAYVIEIAMLSLILEILMIIGLNVFIFRKIFQTRSSLNLFILHKRYPFGGGVLLLMVSIVVHIVQLWMEKTHVMLFNPSLMNISRDAIVVVALLTMIDYVYRVYHEGPSEYPKMEFLKRGAGELTHILRIIHYGLVDTGTGEREVLVNEFLEKTRLREFFDKEQIAFREEDLQTAIEKKPYFAVEICEGMLMFFKNYPRFLSDAQTQYLGEFMAKFSERRRFDENRYKKLWEGLSEVYRNTPSINLRKHLSTLSTYGVSSTYAFFEDRHSTGLKRLDEKTGGIPARSLTVVLKSADVERRMFFYPILMANLDRGRNVVYMVPDLLDKSLSDLGDVEEFIPNGRLKVVSLSQDVAGLEEVEQNRYLVKEHPKELTSFLRDLTRDFPLSSIIILADLNPLMIKDSPADIYAFIRAVNEFLYTKNASMYACVSSNTDPSKLEILRENAEVVVSIDKVNNILYYEVLKSDLKTLAAERPSVEKELYDILRYINKENSSGKKPKFKEIKQNFSISPGTTRKRINELQHRGFLEIHNIGKVKLLEITDKGRELVFQSAIYPLKTAK
ncbi:MAG: hypothetical protein ACE5J5_04570 [Candidatus Hydrothermarchaeales archaeon]